MKTPKPEVNNKWMDTRLRLALLKESAAYRAFWRGVEPNILSAWIKYKRFFESPSRMYSYHENMLCNFEFIYCYMSLDDTPAATCENSTVCKLTESFRTGLLQFHIKAEHPIETIPSVLDPFNDDELPRILPISFSDRVSAIKQVSIKQSPIEHRNFIDGFDECIDILEPEERMFVIDVSRRKGDILAEMEIYLDRIPKIRKIAHKYESFAKNYVEWQPETNRQRIEETWQALKVWKLRRQKKTFLTISNETGLRVPAAKKAFARAYELIEGRLYNPELFKKLYQVILSAEVKRTCKDCPERATCTDPCPDVLAFIDQEHVKLHERHALD
jgi:hypothetical protein